MLLFLRGWVTSETHLLDLFRGEIKPLHACSQVRLGPLAVQRSCIHEEGSLVQDLHANQEIHPSHRLQGAHSLKCLWCISFISTFLPFSDCNLWNAWWNYGERPETKLIPNFRLGIFTEADLFSRGAETFSVSCYRSCVKSPCRRGTQPSSKCVAFLAALIIVCY